MSLNWEFAAISAIGICAICFFVFLLIRSLDSIKWNQTDGRILSSSVEKLGNTKDTSGYTRKISYTYDVNNNTFISKRVFYGDSLYRMTSLNLKDTMKKYPKDKEIKVHYNPNKPNHSVLEPGVNSKIYLLLLVPVICITVLLMISS